jgi:transcriptional regulator with XRE-family HTH domain
MAENLNLLPSIDESFASRLRAVRGFHGLSRKEFCSRSNIPEISLKYWELGKSQISERKLQNLVNSLQKEGVRVTKEWLLYGVGPSPFGEQEKTFTPPGLEPEIQFFLKSNSDSIVQTVIDSLWFPFFEKGDCIGGILIDPQHQRPSSFFALISLPNQKYPRLYRVSIQNDGHLFLFDSCDSMQGRQILHNPLIDQIHRIVWHRKPLDFL